MDNRGGLQTGPFLRQMLGITPNPFELWAEWFKSGGSFDSYDNYGSPICFFCGVYQNGTEGGIHRDNCIYLRAKKMIEDAAE